MLIFCLQPAACYSDAMHQAGEPQWKSFPGFQRCQEEKEEEKYMRILEK